MISSSPRATSCCEIAASRTTRADGQGIRPAAAPMPSSPFQLRSWLVVVVVVVWSWPWRGARARARAAQPASAARPPDAHDQQAGDQRQPGIEVLRQHVLRQRERHDAEREHADRVGHRDRRSERDRVPRAAASADQVGGHHRLAVTRRERVQRAPAEGGQQEQQQHALAGSGVREQAGEAVRRGALSAAPPRSPFGRDQRAVAGRDREVARRGGRAGSTAGPADSGAGRRWGRRSARRVRTAVPSPGRRRPPSSRSGPGRSRRAARPGAGGRRPRAAAAPPASSSGRRRPAGKLSCGCPAETSATRRPSTISTSRRSTSARLRRSTSARPSARSWTVGISAWSRT